LKYALVLVASLFATAASSAEIVGCALTDTKGSDIGYRFAVDSDGDLVELEIVKDGSRLVHAPSARPFWLTTMTNRSIKAVYQPDPEYALVVSAGTRGGNMSARLTRNGNPIAAGVCVLRETVPPPRRPALKIK
jgi:hypothetical protein